MKGSMEEILRFVEQNDAFSIISHVAPDGDTIGSGTALSRILRRLGKRTENVCCDQVPDGGCPGLRCGNSGRLRR